VARMAAIEEAASSSVTRVATATRVVLRAVSTRRAALAPGLTEAEIKFPSCRHQAPELRQHLPGRIAVALDLHLVAKRLGADRAACSSSSPISRGPRCCPQGALSAARRGVRCRPR